MALIASLLAMACGVQAQQFRGPPPGDRPEGPQGMEQGGRQGHPRGPGADGEHRGPPPPPTAELKRLLALNDSQSKALEEILGQQHAQMRQLHERTREQRDAIMDGADARLRKVLSEQQFGRFKQWQATHRPPPPPPGGMPPGGPHGGSAGGPGGRAMEDGPPPRF